MIQCLLSLEGHVQEIQPGAVAEAVHNPRAVIWVDMEAPADAEGDLLRQVFGFHPLAIEDCLSPRLRPPKLDDYGPYLFVVVHGVDHNLPPGVLGTHELDLFLGANYLVTSHRKGSRSVERAKAACLRDSNHMTSPDSLAHHIIDGQVDGMLPPIEEQAQAMSDLKRAILRNPQSPQLSAALELDENLLKVRRVIIPETRALQALSRKTEPFVRDSTRIYLQDIQDHLERLRDMIDMLRDMAESNLSLYISVTANRTADFTKALSLVAMIFLPLSLLAGVYGMNFDRMPELDSRYGYFVVLGIIGVVAGGLLALYRLKRWI